MTSTDRPSFDLVHEPWLPVRDLDGRGDELGIVPALGAAHSLAGVAGDIPTQTFALVRLLLAVLHGALRGPRDVEEWERLWDTERLPVELIAGYLQDHRARFDLFHPETPFLQVADLHTTSGKTSGMAALIADVPNGRPFFTTRLGSDLSLSYAEAARWVVHSQAFDISGIKSGAADDKRVKGGKGYPIGVGWSGLLGGVLVEGATLRETLLLNLLASDFAGRDPATDQPVWQRAPLGPAERQDPGAAPTGPVDLYTWQSRRIRLLPAEGRVRDVLLANGDRLTPQNRNDVEPHTGWRRSEAQQKKLGRPLIYMPREHDPDRAVWRGLESLLPRATTPQKTEASKYLAPKVLHWLGHLSEAGIVERNHLVRVRTIGMIYGNNSSVVAEVIDDALSMRALLARQDAGNLAGVATSCVAAAEGAATALGNLAAHLAEACGADTAGPRSRAREAAFAELDGPFRAWLAGLAAGSDPTGVQIAWHRTAYWLVRGLAEDLQRRTPPTAWAGREVRKRRLTPAHADRYFRDGLRKALPLAHTENAASA
jgi:CRISPR system Cascade subunit CasA